MIFCSYYVLEQLSGSGVLTRFRSLVSYTRRKRHKTSSFLMFSDVFRCIRNPKLTSGVFYVYIFLWILAKMGS